MIDRKNEEGNTNPMADIGLYNALNQYKDNISIYPTKRKDKNGTDISGIAFPYEDEDGHKQRKVFTGRSEKELLEKRSTFLAELYFKKRDMLKKLLAPNAPVYPFSYPGQQALAPVCDKTMVQAVDDFLEYYKPTVSHQTYLGEVTDTNFIKANLGSKKVSDLTFNDVQSLINARGKKNNGEPATEKTVKNLIISFKMLMKYCRKQKWLSAEDLELITSGIKIPTPITDTNHAEEVKQSKFLEYAEIGEILGVLIKNLRYYLVARILFLTGMRPQEFFGLEKDDLFPEENYINVRQALVVNEKVNGNDRGVKVGTTKNRGSRRRVPAVDQVFVYFDELEKLLKKSDSRINAVKKGNGNMVMVDKNGNIIDIHSFGTNMGKHLINNHYKGKRFTLNMPRHCFQDHLDRLDARDNDVEKAVGHVIDNVAERYYKTNDNYIERLIPLIESMDKEIENAYQNTKKYKRIYKKPSFF